MTQGRGRQLPLILPHRPALGAGDFLVGEENREAYAAIMRWPDWPAPVAWLFGPPGSGKTHLVEAWLAESGGLRIAAADLAGAEAEALLVGGAAAIEDVDRGGEERVLFHILNAARERGSSLLLTSRAGPGDFVPVLRDLASRLRAAFPVALAAPGDDLLRQVLVKLFADRQLEVEPAVIGYILNRMERSFEAAARLVARLDEAALAEGRAVTRRLAARVLDDDELNSRTDVHI